MAYTCNPSYSGGQDQEDRGLKPAWENSLQDLILKTLHKNRVSGVAQGEGLEFKPQYHKKEQCVPDVVVHSCNSSTEEAEVGEPGIQSQPGLHIGTLSQTNKHNPPNNL
jgi:hypothetical protein